MRNIFVDTNILLDVILHRDGFWEEAVTVWADSEFRKNHVFISAISLNNVYYIIRKRFPQDVALKYIRLMLSVFSVVPLDETILRRAADFPHKDYEDAIQIFSAVRIKADCIVTRDRSHFANEYVQIVSPTEYRELFRA